MRGDHAKLRVAAGMPSTSDQCQSNSQSHSHSKYDFETALVHSEIAARKIEDENCTADGSETLWAACYLFDLPVPPSFLVRSAITSLQVCLVPWSDTRTIYYMSKEHHLVQSVKPWQAVAPDGELRIVQSFDSRRPELRAPNCEQSTP